MNISLYLLHTDDMQFSAIDLGDDRLRGWPVQFYTRHIVSLISRERWYYCRRTLLSSTRQALWGPGDSRPWFCQGSARRDATKERP